MKNQTNTTIEYTNRHTNLNQFYKRFLLKAVSMIAIPILTVSMIPSFALADDVENVNDSNQIDTQTVRQMVQDTNSTTHTISVNLSIMKVENPYQSVLLDESDLIPEPTNDVTVYTAKAFNMIVILTLKLRVLLKFKQNILLLTATLIWSHSQMMNDIQLTVLSQEKSVVVLTEINSMQQNAFTMLKFVVNSLDTITPSLTFVLNMVMKVIKTLTLLNKNVSTVV